MFLGEKSSSGHLEFSTLEEAVEALVICNHIPLSGASEFNVTFVTWANRKEINFHIFIFQMSSGRIPLSCVFPPPDPVSPNLNKKIESFILGVLTRAQRPTKCLLLSMRRLEQIGLFLRPLLNWKVP